MNYDGDCVLISTLSRLPIHSSYETRNCTRQLGVGTEPIPRKKLDVENLAHAIHEATSSSSIRQRARALGEQIRQEDGLAAALNWVQHYLV